ncbi:hypothetical protein BaRGS_00012750 [Batillaria attramentaria]|uniref:SH2 domain-containing protein n=1 Tax=Batillaria attramentaria TaxID=370345 RepID=A0ABD0L902_9CAEN
MGCKQSYSLGEKSQSAQGRAHGKRTRISNVVATHFCKTEVDSSSLHSHSSTPRPEVHVTTRGKFQSQDIAVPGRKLSCEVSSEMKKMEDYTEPRDSKRLRWGQNNTYDSDADDEGYSQPFEPDKNGRPPAAEGTNYDIPPSREDDYSRLRTVGSNPSRTGGQGQTSVVDSGGVDDYNHTETWSSRQVGRQRSGGSGVQTPPSDTKAQHGAASHVRRSGGVRKHSSSSGVGEGKPIPNARATPALYEEAWDSTQRQKELEERLRLARTISSTSDKFEDALEYQPEEPAPPERMVKPGTQTDPVTGGNYEQAWDLNKGLEQRLLNMRMMRNDAGDINSDAYQEPWDTAKKQRELEEKLQRVSMEGGSPLSPKLKSQQSGSDVYEEAWDTKRNTPHAVDAMIGSQFSARSHQSICSTVGEPINAMIPLDSQDWYHGNISREDAEQILCVCKDGSYLVRDSSDGFHYTLCIKNARMTIHIQIDQCQKPAGGIRYILGKNSKAFETIPAMIDYYTQHPVPIKGADHMALMYPVPCKWSKADG